MVASADQVANALLTVCLAVADVMRQLKELGATSHLLDRMVSLQDCFNIVGPDEMLSRDASYSLETQPAG